MKREQYHATNSLKGKGWNSIYVTQPKSTWSDEKELNLVKRFVDWKIYK